MKHTFDFVTFAASAVFALPEGCETKKIHKFEKKNGNIQPPFLSANSNKSLHSLLTVVM